MKLNVKYISNQIEYKNLTDEHKLYLNDVWENLREDYIDWISKIKDKNYLDNKNILNTFTWNGMPTWWLNRLTHKNSFHSNEWLNRIMILWLCKKFDRKIILNTDDKILINAIKLNHFNITINNNKSLLLINIKSILKFLVKKNLFLVSFFKMVLFYCFIKLFVEFKFHTQNIKKNTIWFKTLFPINWKLNEAQQLTERIYLDSPYLDKKYAYNTAFLCFITMKPHRTLKDFFQLKKNLKAFMKHCKRPVYLPEKELKFNDIFNSYSSTFFERIKFLSLKKKKYFKSIFNMNEIDISTILFEEWENSYNGIQQISKIQGLATSRFFSKLPDGQKIINYNEFSIINRAGHYLCKINNPLNIFISIQHAMNCKNKMFTYFRKSEIGYYKDNFFDNLLPSPDYFFVHGNKYKNILKTFYNEKLIRVIGDLKKANSNYKKNINYSRSYNFFFSKDYNYILLAPSTGDDYKYLLNIFNKWKKKNWKILLSAHPTQNLSEIITYQKKKYPELEIDYPRHIDTNTILKKSKILITSFSSIALDGFVEGIKVARYVPFGILPQFDIDKRIPTFFSTQKLISWIEKNMNTFNELQINIKKNFIEDYFYKLDNGSNDRLWKEIHLILKDGKA